MLTLTDINRALDRLGVEPFIPRTRRALAGSLPTSSPRTTGPFQVPELLHNDEARPPEQRLMIAPGCVRGGPLTHPASNEGDDRDQLEPARSASAS